MQWFYKHQAKIPPHSFFKELFKSINVTFKTWYLCPNDSKKMAQKNISPCTTKATPHQTHWYERQLQSQDMSVEQQVLVKYLKPQLKAAGHHYPQLAEVSANWQSSKTGFAPNNVISHISPVPSTSKTKAFLFFYYVTLKKFQMYNKGFLL